MDVPERPADAAAPAAGSGTQSIQRAALLLRHLSWHNRTGLRLVDLYRKAHLERSTTHRILQSLVAERLVVQDQSSKRYHLGPFAYEMGLAAAPPLPLRDICHSHLRRLADVSGDTVFLTARAEFDGVCLDRTEGAYPVKAFVLEVGRRRPLGVGGGGLAILSLMEPVEVDRILRANAQRLADRFPRYSERTAKAAIARARRVGHVLQDVQEVPGIRSLAMALRGEAGQPLAALSISAMSHRLEGERISTLLSAMAQAVQVIESELGLRKPTVVE